MKDYDALEAKVHDAVQTAEKVYVAAGSIRSYPYCNIAGWAKSWMEGLELSRAAGTRRKKSEIMWVARETEQFHRWSPAFHQPDAAYVMFCAARAARALAKCWEQNPSEKNIDWHELASKWAEKAISSART